MRYSDYLADYTPSTAGAYFVYRGNGPFDPQYSTGGAQPLGWDRWAALYQTYCVLGCKIKIHVKNLTNSVTPVLFYLRATTSATGNTFAATSEAIIPLNSNTRWCELQGPNTGRNTKVMKMYVTTNKMFSTPIDGHTYTAATNNVPQDQWYWTFGMISNDATTLLAYEWRVKLTYYTIFKQRINTIQGQDLQDTGEDVAPALLPTESGNTAADTTGTVHYY